MVIASEFIDPFYDDITAFPIDSSKRPEFNANIIELIIGAVVFLSIVAIYNALFSIWEKLLGRSSSSSPREFDDLQQEDDIIVRVTYAVLVVIIAYLVILYFSPKGASPFSRVLRGR